MSAKPIPREDHFRLLSDEPPAVIPAGYEAPLDDRSTHEMIADRQEWLASTETCPACDGHGRVPKKDQK